MTRPMALQRDEDGLLAWHAVSDDERDLCPVCGHAPTDHREGFGCMKSIGYDHMNGFHECECPMLPRVDLDGKDGD